MMYAAPLHCHKKVIFFDLHGTLITKKMTPDQALRAALLDYTDRWVSEEKASLINKACRIYRHALRQYKRKGKPSLTKQMRIACLKRALANLPIAKDELTLTRIDQKIVSLASSQEEHIKRVAAVLRSLRQRYQLAVITNGQEPMVRARLKRNQLASAFSPAAVFVSSSLGKGKSKPHPGIYRHALAQMQVQPEQALMVGDSWRQDIEGATSCGIDAVWLNPWNRPIPRPIAKARLLIIREIDELLEIL